MDMMGGGSGMMGGMWFFPLLFWILIVVGVVMIMQWLMNRNKISQSAESPLDILNKRYAQGDIDRDNYERMKKDIRNPNP